MSNRDKVYSNHMLLGEIFTLSGQELVVELIMMDIPNFDIDMDFLRKYGLKIDCSKKNLQFSLDNRDEFSYEEGQVLNMMVNNIKAKKC